ncbi:YraN family protein [Pseudooceanicola sp.]|uniref:YraN family protein n=1 Tax=Pseudooceanicola sp. TaxID=1914328 RepID=UPI0035C6A3DF
MRHSQYEFDFTAAQPVSPPSAEVPVGQPPVGRRQRRGRVAYLSGLAAESSVERHYAACGMTCLDRRWRGPGGEIDLIFRDGDRIIFVEVKAAASHEAAASRIGQRQADRIAASAQAYLDRFARGGLTDMRMDVALVDQQGRIAVLENAFSGWW